MGVLGYLGPKGTHSEAVALYLNSVLHDKLTLRAYPDIYNAIWDVEKGVITSCIVPVENSLEGSIDITLDTLSTSDEIVVLREVIWQVHNNLMAMGEATAIERIISHAQPLSQCRDYIRQHYPKARIEAVMSTADAARIASTDATAAAICTERAGSLYGLGLIAANIEDNANNCTRFYQLGRTKDSGVRAVADAGQKSILIFQIDGTMSGSLCNILNDLATRKINIRRIESRPARTTLGEYIFFLDIDVPSQEYRLDDALEDIAKKSIWVKNPGRYAVLRAN